ncbi:MAG: hypothetical protein P1U77_27055 [Rubripirellula sp.]|nr:hypothetical protein [Rubripirellula sp.]
MSISPITTQDVASDLQVELFDNPALQNRLGTGVVGTPFDLGELSWSASGSNTYYARVISTNRVKTDYELNWSFASTPDSLETSSSPNDGPNRPFLIDSPSVTRGLTGLTLPTSQRANAGDYFRLDIGSTSDVITLHSQSPDQVITLELLSEDGLTSIATAATVAGGSETAFLDLSTVSGFTAGSYQLRVSAPSAPAVRYDLELDVSRSLTGTGSLGAPFSVGNLDLFEPYRSTAALGTSPDDEAGDTWFRFTLSQPGGEAGDGLGIRALSETGDNAVASPDNRFQLELSDSFNNLLQTISTYTDDPTTVFDLAGLAAGVYSIRVSGYWELDEGVGDYVAQFSDGAAYQFYSSTGPIEKFDESFATSSVNDYSTPRPVRRDVLLGGLGNDVLIGGSGSDWIFGGTNQPLPSGQHDDAADSSILVDSTQSWETDELVGRKLFNLTDGSEATIVSNTGTSITASLSNGSDNDWDINDRYQIGQDNDILSGGYDKQAEDLIVGGQGDDVFLLVPDYLPEFGGQGFDAGNSDLFVGGDGNDQTYFVGGDVQSVDIPDFVTLGYDRFLGRHKLSALVYDKNSASDSSLPKFAAQDGRFLQQFAFFRAEGIERTVVDTRGGNDVVHADPGYLLNSETWGISAGDLAAGASAFEQLVIIGGRGLDVLHGGASSDVIVGDEFATIDSGRNWLGGYSGDDILLGASGVDYMYGNRLPASLPNIGGIIDETPDSPSLPPETTGVIDAFEYFVEFLGESPALTWTTLDNRSPVNAQAGVDLPGTASATTDLSSAFALEGLGDNQQLESIIAAGDVNADGEQDFLVSSAAGESYLMFGPVAQSSLFRATSAEVNNKNVVEVTGDRWSFTQEFDIDTAGNALFEALAPSVRAEGRASVIFNSTGNLGKAVGSGQLLGDGQDHASDLVFLKDDGSDWTISIVAGAQTLTREIDSADRTIKIAKGTLGWSLDDIQVHVLDWTGTSEDGGDGLDEIIVLGKPPAGSDPDESRVAGYLFSGAQIQTADRTQADAWLTLTTDETNREAVVRTFGNSLDTAQTTASQLVSASVGDVNRDGFDDLVFGDARYAHRVGGNDWEAVGRVYLVLGQQSNTNLGTQPILSGGPTSASGTNAYSGLSDYVWQGFTLGASVAGVGDANTDGFAEIAFTRGIEEQTGTGSLFVLAGSEQYGLEDSFWPTGSSATDSTNLPNPAASSDGQRNVVLERISRATNDNATLHVSAGDFDGNGLQDIAVSDSVAGSVRMFYDFANAPLQSPARSRDYDTQHDGEIIGVDAGDTTDPFGVFGVLSSTHSLDLDGDGASDFVIGAPLADISTSTLSANENAGRIYVMFGAGRTLGLPEGRQEEVLANRQLPKGGLYVVERPDGTPFQYFGDESTRLSNEVGFALGAVNSGIAVHDGAMGSAYVLYSRQPVANRLENVADGNSRQLTAVRYSSGTWEYSDDAESEWLPFKPVDTDILLAQLDLDAHTITRLNWGVPVNGIRQGSFGGDLTFEADTWNGANAPGKYTVGGTEFFRSETDQWFSFDLLGDGQIGDVLKLRVNNGVTQAISRPERAALYSTSLTTVESELSGADVLDPLAFVLPWKKAGYDDTNGLIEDVPTGGWEVGTPAIDQRLILELDLSRLLDLAEQPDLVDDVTIVLPFEQPSGVGGTVYAKLLDAEGDGIASAADATGTTDRFRNATGGFAQYVKPVGDGIPGSTYDPVTLNVTQEVRDAIAVGKTRLTFRIESDVANPLRIDDDSMRIDLRTSRRDGVVADLFDGDGRRVSGGPNAASIIDLRSLPAGKYHIRVFDPFAQPDHNLYDNKYDPTVDRAEDVQFVVEIEAPKIGEADALTDRDELRGGGDNDVLVGNGYYDRLFGGLGEDIFVAESVEIRDLSFDGPNEASNVSGVVVGEEGYLIARPDDFEITRFAEAGDSQLELAIAQQLGLTSVDAANLPRLRRPLRATDLTALVELDADPYSLGRFDGDTSPHTLSSLAGLEYAVNLEYLTIAGQNVSSLSRIEPGIRLGREEQGELGLSSLRFIDADRNPLQIDVTEAYPSTQVGPLHVLSRLSNLEYVSIDSLPGAVESGGSNLNGVFANTYYDLSFAENLGQLRWLSARDNEISTHQDVFLESSYAGGQTAFGWYPLDQLSGNYSSNATSGAPSSVVFGGVSESDDSSPAPGVESRNAGSYLFDGIDGHVAIPLRENEDLWGEVGDAIGISFWFKTD